MSRRKVAFDYWAATIEHDIARVEHEVAGAHPSARLNKAHSDLIGAASFRQSWEAGQGQGVPKLCHDMPIRAKAWNDTAFARVWTLEGCCAANRIDYAAAKQRALDRSHDLASSVYSKLAPIGDQELAAILADAARAIAARAVTLASGDVVSIDGAFYTVAISPGNEWKPTPMNSDPVKFVRVRT